MSPQSQARRRLHSSLSCPNDASASDPIHGSASQARCQGSCHVTSFSNPVHYTGLQTCRQWSRRAALLRSNIQMQKRLHQSDSGVLDHASTSSGADVINESVRLLRSNFQEQQHLHQSNSGVLDDASTASGADVNSESVRLTDYIDLGSCTEMCEFCGELFWFVERLLSYPLSQPPRYNKCCKSRRVSLEYPSNPPALLRSLFADAHFLSNIRAYNSMFSMTSFGAVIDDTINNGGGPYVFKIVGQISHWIGSLFPQPGQQPRFLQMYIFDCEHEVPNRLRFFSGVDRNQLSEGVVAALVCMLGAVNEDVHLFKSARELYLQVDVPKLHLSYMPLQYPMRKRESPQQEFLTDIPISQIHSCLIQNKILNFNIKKNNQVIKGSKVLTMQMQLCRYSRPFCYWSAWLPNFLLQDIIWENTTMTKSITLE